MILLLKLALAPALVVSSSLAGRRWGPAAAGTLVALPIVAGPILLITCLEQGTAFGAQAAAASLLGLTSLALFTLVLAWASRSMQWRLALPVAWAVCLIVDVFLSRLTVRPGWGFLLVLGSAWTVARLLPVGVGAGFALATVGTVLVQLIVQRCRRHRSGRFRNSRSPSEHDRSTVDERREAVDLRFRRSTAS